jgi:hypothetical protein
MNKIQDSIKEHIASTGLSVMGVSADPTFSYTIGLLERYGYELIVVGLRAQYAQIIFNEIAHEWLPKGPLAVNVPVLGLASMPTMFRMCSPELVKDYGVQAFVYHQRDSVPFLQMVLPDRAGRFPHDPDYDVEHMGPLQTLLYKQPGRLLT